MACLPTKNPFACNVEKKKNKATNEQIMALRREMTLYPTLLNLNNPQTDIIWEKLKNKLNALGTEKTISQWKKSWKDQEKHVLIPVAHAYPQELIQTPMRRFQNPTATAVNPADLKFRFKDISMTNPLKRALQPQMHSQSVSQSVIHTSPDHYSRSQSPVMKVNEQLQQSSGSIIFSSGSTVGEGEDLLTTENTLKKEVNSIRNWNLPAFPPHEPKQFKIEMNEPDKNDVECVGFSINNFESISCTSNDTDEEAVRPVRPVIVPNAIPIRNSPAQNTAAALSAMDHHNAILLNLHESMNKITATLEERSEQESLYQATVISVLEEISADIKKLLTACSRG